MYGIDCFYVHFFLLYCIYCKILYESDNTTEKNKLENFILLVIPLFILGMCRGDLVGGDLKRYLPTYDKFSTAPWSEIWEYASVKEPGYLIFIKLIGEISSGSHRVYLMLTSACSLIGPLLFFRRHSNNVYFSILLYFAWGFYTNTFNNVRQSLAMSIFFISLPYLFDRKIIKYSICSLIAFSFHYSGLIMIILYPLSSFLLDKKKILLITIWGVCLFFLAGTSILYYLIVNFFVKYNPDSFFEVQGGGNNLLILYGIISTLLSWHYLKNKTTLVEHEKYFYSFLLLCQILATLLQLFASIYPSMTRLTSYFFIPLCVTIPFIANISDVKSKNKFLYLTSFILYFYMMLSVYSYNEATNSNKQAVIPYVFFDITLY